MILAITIISHVLNEPPTYSNNYKNNNYYYYYYYSISSKVMQFQMNNLPVVGVLHNLIVHADDAMKPLKCMSASF